MDVLRDALSDYDQDAADDTRRPVLGDSAGWHVITL